MSLSVCTYVHVCACIYEYVFWIFVLKASAKEETERKPLSSLHILSSSHGLMTENFFKNVFFSYLTLKSVVCLSERTGNNNKRQRGVFPLFYNFMLKENHSGYSFHI